MAIVKRLYTQRGPSNARLSKFVAAGVVATERFRSAVCTIEYDDSIAGLVETIDEYMDSLGYDSLGINPIIDVIARVGDPAAAPGRVEVYSKTIAGVTHLFAREDDGSIFQMTPVSAPSPSLALFGSGFDGALNFDGVSNVGAFAGMSLVPAAGKYQLLRDVFATDITIADGVIVETLGFRIFATGTLTMGAGAVIRMNGGDGGDGGAAAGGVAGAVSLALGILGNGTAGAVGTPSGGGNGAGSGGPARSHLGRATVATPGGNNSDGANGGVMTGGGGGGNGPTGNQGGSGGTVAPQAIDWFDVTGAIRGKNVESTTLGAGSGGGSGAGGTVANPGGGGGGGAGGGTVLVCANQIVGAGEIQAIGGNGGGAFATSQGGGGGGGGGGVIAVVTRSAFPLPVALNVNGGVGGNGGANGGQNGGNGGGDLAYTFAA